MSKYSSDAGGSMEVTPIEISETPHCLNSDCLELLVPMPVASDNITKNIPQCSNSNPFPVTK